MANLTFPVPFRSVLASRHDSEVSDTVLITSLSHQSHTQHHATRHHERCTTSSGFQLSHSTLSLFSLSSNPAQSSNLILNMEHLQANNLTQSFFLLFQKKKRRTGPKTGSRHLSPRYLNPIYVHSNIESSILLSFTSQDFNNGTSTEIISSSSETSTTNKHLQYYARPIT